MEMQKIMESIRQWISNQPAWISYAIYDLKTGRDPAIGKLALMCIRAARGRRVIGAPPDGTEVAASGTSGSVKILSMSGVSGINKLKEQSSLDFGAKHMSVVYGLNGAGKSSYVRILKAVAGAADSRELLTNVYSEATPPQTCTVKYSVGGVEKTVQWAAGQNPIDDLRHVDIFDTSRGEVYFEENEVTYEPPVLMLFTRLIDVANAVAQKIECWRKPVYAVPAPETVVSTETYRRITGSLGNESFRQLLNAVTWTETDGRNVDELRARLSEKTPMERAKEVQKRKIWLEKLIADVRQRASGLSDEQYKRIVAAKRNADLKRQVADVAAKELFSSSAKLEGVGSAVWRELWKAAQDYAAEKAYPGQEYPGKAKEVRCVLCHQLLAPDARKRMEAFENYVKGTAQKEADAALLAAKNLIDGLPAEFEDEVLSQRLDVAGVTDAEARKLLVSFNASVKNRRLLFSQNAGEAPLPTLVNLSGWVTSALEEVAKLDSTVQTLLSDAQNGEAGREKLRCEVVELLAKKWIFENRQFLGRLHVNRRLNADLDAAKRLTATTRMSMKKSELAEAVITEAYAARFRDELDNLSGGRIRVTLAKSRVMRGRVLHRIGLTSAKKVELKSVLSEGESRIVSLAAFLADSEGNQTTSPFVFDDPISSLDQNYEEAVAKRLIRLATTRQVIIFTHRLSMLGTIVHYLKHYKEELHVEADYSALREFDGVAGVKTEFPMGEKSIEGALNRMVRETASRCRRLKEAEDYHAYENALKGMCSDFRVLVESSVETDLLCGIVQRYMRAVSTMKIPQLAKMKDTDHQLLNELMTKYSGFEHSQPQEAPVPLPPLDDVIADANRLIVWRDEYRKRKHGHV